MSKHKFILIFISLILIIFLGLKYRFRSYESFPPVSESFDEQVLVWVGSSLINTGIPVGWSFIDDYVPEDKTLKVGIDGWSITLDKKKPTVSNFSTFPKPLAKKQELTLDGYTSQFTMVQPHIEQPPLGPLLSSFLSGSFKNTTFEQVNLKQMRFPVILFSAFSILLTFLIAYFSFGSVIGLLSALIYALMPIVVVSSRMVTAENYLTPFLLLGIFLTQLWIIKSNDRYFFAASILITICYLIKPFGIGLAGVIFLSILVFEKPVKYFLFPIIFSFLGMAIFYMYGNFYDPLLFQKIVAYQMNRLFSPLSGIQKIILPKITRVFLDGWLIFSWLSIAALAFKDDLKKNFWILAPVFSYLIIFLMYGGYDYGWYRLPIYPYLAIASAVLLIKGIRNITVWIGLTFLITAFSTSLYWAFFGMQWASNALQFRIFMLIILISLTSGFLKSKLKIVSSIILVILTLVTFWLNIRSINNMQLIWPFLTDKI